MFYFFTYWMFLFFSWCTFWVFGSPAFFPSMHHEITQTHELFSPLMDRRGEKLEDGAKDRLRSEIKSQKLQYDLYVEGMNEHASVH